MTTAVPPFRPSVRVCAWAQPPRHSAYARAHMHNARVVVAVVVVVAHMASSSRVAAATRAPGIVSHSDTCIKYVPPPPPPLCVRTFGYMWSARRRFILRVFFCVCYLVCGCVAQYGGFGSVVVGARQAGVFGPGAAIERIIAINRLLSRLDGRLICGKTSVSARELLMISINRFVFVVVMYT